MNAHRLRLSPSALSLYSDCPRCFWLQMNRKLKRPEAPFSTLPSGLDLAIKHYFDAHRGSRDLPPILEGKLQAKLVPDQQEIKKLRSPKFGFWDESLDAEFRGMLDECVIEGNGAYAPLDHKTRGYPPKETHPSYIMQMSSYSLMLARNDYPISDSAYLVYYYPVRESDSLHRGFPFQVEVRQVRTDPAGAYKAFAQAVATVRSETMPQSSERCAYCSFVRRRTEAG
jgi:CRISPR/Cas system-associated exonuclease Cas4 (RecB family)